VDQPPWTCGAYLGRQCTPVRLRHCMSRGVRTCLKRSKSNASFKSTGKHVYKRKLGSAALAFIDAEVHADRKISARELQKRLHWTE